LNVEPVSAAVAMVPFEFVKLTGKEALSMLKLLDILEDHEDLQHVWSNVDIDEKEIEASLT
jgi:transcriptional/translational regulatory protein YebC/TACO1